MPDTRRYARLKGLLQDKITSGDYSPGDRFYSQTELMKKYGLSFSTVIRALDELVREGYLVRRQGKGTFIANASPMTPAAGTQTVHLTIFAPWSSNKPGNRGPVDLPGIYRELQKRKPDWVELRLVPLSGAQDELEPYLFSREPMDAALFFYPSAAQAAVLEKMASHCPVTVVTTDGHLAAPAFSSILTDVGAGTQLAVEELLRRGHTAVGLVLPPDNHSYGAECTRGYRMAIRGAGLAFRETLLITAEATDLNGYHATLGLVNMNSDVRVSAVVAGSGDLLMGVKYAVQSMGLAVPEQVAVACVCGCCDDGTDGPAADPVLHVRFPAADVAEACVQLCEARLRGKPAENLVVAPVLERTEGENGV